MIRMRRLLASLVPLFAATLVLSACDGRESAADVAADKGLLLIGNGSEPRTLDPALNTGVPERFILDALFEGLTSVDPKDPSNALPGVAESWEHDADFTRWTFHLRPDARWSDGTPVTAQDFVFAWRRALAPALGAEMAEFLYQLKNARAVNRGTMPASALGVSAADDRTLLVTLEGPTPYFPQLLCFYPWFPLNEASIRAHGGVEDRANPWTKPGNMVSNGPFLLSGWITNQSLDAQKNPQYWDAAKVRLKSVRFLPVEDQQSEEAMFRAGEIHVTESIPVDKVASYARRGDPAFHSEPMLGTYYLTLNTARPALADRRVREALSLAIDRKLLTERALGSGELPATGFVPVGFAGFADPPALPFDPATARRLLAEAGYPGGKGFPAFELLINTGESHRKIAQVLQAMWKDNLGIDIGIYNQEWKVYLDTVAKEDYDLARAGWIAPYYDPMAFLEGMTGDNPNNHTGWKSAAYDRQIEKARRAASPDDRMRAMEAANAVLRTDLPIVPIYNYRSNYLKDPRVLGWEPNPQRKYPLKYVYFADAK